MRSMNREKTCGTGRSASRNLFSFKSVRTPQRFERCRPLKVPSAQGLRPPSSPSRKVSSSSSSLSETKFKTRNCPGRDSCSWACISPSSAEATPGCGGSCASSGIVRLCAAFNTSNAFRLHGAAAAGGGIFFAALAPSTSPASSSPSKSRHTTPPPRPPWSGADSFAKERGAAQSAHARKSTCCPRCSAVQTRQAQKRKGAAGASGPMGAIGC
mmetsp:Transcript_20929/g.72198  ORF Transcript_20929/g.72198 Transcript_20929/m.72198 type:complete len:213 (-) Transcript_20929:30-668(-)